MNRQDSVRSTISQPSNKVYITNFDKDIIDQYIQHRQSLEFKKMSKIFFDVNESPGHIPEAREAAQLCTHRESFYLFGGIGSKRFDYFNEYDMNQKRWFKRMPKNVIHTDLPAQRFGHTMNTYRDYFVLFGGCGNYSEKTKLHESFNDVRFYDIKNEQWLRHDYTNRKSSFKQFESAKRMYHAAAIL